MELSGRSQGKCLELQLGSRLVRIYLLILDDLGPHRLSAQQPLDLYELVIARHRSASFAITSNRAVEEWRGGEAEIRVEAPLIEGWLPLHEVGIGVPRRHDRARPAGCERGAGRAKGERSTHSS